MHEQADMALLAHGFRAGRIAAPFPLWLIAADAPPAPALLECLDPAERARAARFLRDDLRHRYQVAHCALRTAVAAVTGIAAASQVWQAGSHGKPLLEQAPELDCSISYSGGHILLGMARGRAIGVDLEEVRPIEDALQLASMYYTDREIAQLAERSAQEADHAFLTVWVCKEACSKALGRGLSIPPASFECGVGTGVRDVMIENEVAISSVLDPKGGLLASWAFVAV